MKKIFFPLVVFGTMMICASCTQSVEDKADNFVKEECEAAEKMDMAKAQKISEEAEAYRKELSAEDQAKFDSVTLVALEKYSPDALKKFKDVGKSLGSALEGASDVMKEANDMMDNVNEATSDDASSDDASNE